MITFEKIKQPNCNEKDLTSKQVMQLLLVKSFSLQFGSFIFSNVITAAGYYIRLFKNRRAMQLFACSTIFF